MKKKNEKPEAPAEAKIDRPILEAVSKNIKPFLAGMAEVMPGVTVELTAEHRNNRVHEKIHMKYDTATYPEEEIPF